MAKEPKHKGEGGRKAAKPGGSLPKVGRNRPIPIKRADGEIEFSYIKSNSFRVIYVDGIHGGVVPTGKQIHMAFFNERSPIPQKQVFAVTRGKLSPTPLRSEGKKGIVREVEMEAIMSLATAKAIRGWLDKMIEAAEKIDKLSKGDGQ